MIDGRHILGKRETDVEVPEPLTRKIADTTLNDTAEWSRTRRTLNKAYRDLSMEQKVHGLDDLTLFLCSMIDHIDRLIQEYMQEVACIISPRMETS